MSLIEEALRKQKEESERTEKTPAVPPPLPEPDSSATEQTNAATTTRPWRLLAGLLLGGIVIVVVILLLFVYGVFLWQSPEKPAMGSKNLSTTTTPILATVKTALVERASTPTNHSSATGVQVSATETQSAITVTSTPPPTNPPPTPAITRPLPAPEKAILTVIWPRLLISGIIGGGKTGHSAVIINGKMLSPGDSIENVKVVTIEKQRVKLVYEGEDRVLSAGSSTE